MTHSACESQNRIKQKDYYLERQLPNLFLTLSLTARPVQPMLGEVSHGQGDIPGHYYHLAEVWKREDNRRKAHLFPFWRLVEGERREI